jgi:hypothetical protein
MGHNNGNPLILRKSHDGGARISSRPPFFTKDLRDAVAEEIASLEADEDADRETA